MKVIKYIFFGLIINFGINHAMDLCNASKIEFETKKTGIKDCIVATRKGKQIGLIVFEDNKIENLDVDQKYRKQGIGSHLFVACLKKLEDKNYTKAEWFALNSVSFYRRFGAVTIGNPWKSGKADKDFSSHMQFVFEYHGDPAQNFEKFKRQQSKTR